MTENECGKNVWWHHIDSMRMYKIWRHSFLQSANSVLECNCLSSESCNLYRFFFMGSRADWKQQLDSAAESHQPPNDRFEQRKAKAKRSRKVEWTGKLHLLRMYFWPCLFASSRCRRLLHAFYLLEASSHVLINCSAMNSDVSFNTF